MGSGDWFSSQTFQSPPPPDKPKEKDDPYTSMEQTENIASSEEKFDTVSLEFRDIIKSHIKLLKSSEDVAMNDMDKYEKIEAMNKQNLNVIAYCVSFMIYKFIDVDPFVQKSNVAWVSKIIIKASSMTDKGRQMDKTSYYFFKDKLRDYLTTINVELTRIDDQPIDVWKHGYDKLDDVLKKNGIQNALE